MVEVDPLPLVPATVSTVALGETTPNPEQLKKMSKAFNVSVDEILDNDSKEFLMNKISNTEREIAKMVWDLEGRKYARWAKENLNTSCKGVIVEIGDITIAELIEPIYGLKCELVNYKGERLWPQAYVAASCRR